MSDAAIGFGTIFEVSNDGGATYVAIAEVTSITPPAFSVDTPDVTHMQSPGGVREFIPGLTDPGECSIEQNFLPGSPSEAVILGLLRMKAKCRITWPAGQKWTFDGILTSYAPAAPLDDKMTATTAFKVSSSVVVAAAGAPVNSVKPAISGVAQVGQVLTAYPGEWSGAPTYAYQWKNEGVNLAGATAKTYTPVGTDVADTLTVTVTATNSAGSASATSAGLADISA